jgi:hypothetical protein
MMHPRLAGTNLNVATRRLRELGGIVEPQRGTGELRFFHRIMGRAIRANGRRKDAPCHVIRYIQRCEVLLDPA